MEKTTSFVVVGEKTDIRVKSVMASRKFNVVDYRWVLECIERKTYEFPAMQHVSERDGERGDVFSLWRCWKGVCVGVIQLFSFVHPWLPDHS